MPQVSLQARRPSREGSPHPSLATLRHDTWHPESCCGTEALPGLEEGTRPFGAHSSLLRLGWELEPRMAPKGQGQLKASRVCMLKLRWPLCMVLVWNHQHQLPYEASPRLPSRARLGQGLEPRPCGPQEVDVASPRSGDRDIEGHSGQNDPAAQGNPGPKGPLPPRARPTDFRRKREVTGAVYHYQ